MQKNKVAFFIFCVDGIIVNGHARSLVLLALHIHRLGVDQTGDALIQLMAELQDQYPDDRERSLYDSVELSLRFSAFLNRKVNKS